MTEPPRAAPSPPENAPPFADWSRGFTRLALGVAALLLAVGAFLAAMLEESSGRVDAAATDELRNLTLNLERYYFTRLQATDLVLQSAVQEFATLHGDPAGPRFTAMLERLRLRLPEAPPMRATDAAGQVLYGAGEPVPPVSVAQRRFFREAQAGDALVIGLPLRSRASNRFVLPVARALRDGAGRFAGVVYVTLDLDDFAGVLANLKVGERGVITILNDHRDVIARWPPLPPTADESPRRLTAAPLLAALATGRPVAAYTTESSLDGVRRSAIVRRVGPYPVWVLLGLAEDEIRAPWVRELRLALLFWLALAFGGALLLVLQRRRERTLAALMRQLDAARLQADAANRSKSMFLANMSHEIRTPLNGVLGFAQVGQLDPATPEPARQRFRRILQSGKLLQTLLDDVLDVSRIEAGKLPLEPLPTDVREIAGQVVDLLDDTARAKGLALALEVAPDVPRTILVDPLRLQQVLINLASNAVKFTDAGRVALRVRTEGERLAVEVADTGVGMAGGELARLFEAFEQADASVTRRYGGSGLGLTITRHLVALMGGTIAVDSRVGQGTTFVVRLPLRPVADPDEAAAPPVPAAATLPERALQGLHVLVVEDNPINRLVLESLLKLEGARVDLADDGHAAIARVADARAPRYDVALLDIEMPGIDGYETARRLLEIDPALPLLGQTARAMADDLAQCLRAGMRGRVAKPIERGDLVRLVRAHARRTRAA